jgi:hypothetical protein
MGLILAMFTCLLFNFGVAILVCFAAFPGHHGGPLLAVFFNAAVGGFNLRSVIALLASGENDQ